MITKREKKEIKKLMRKKGFWSKQTKELIEKIEQSDYMIFAYKIDLLGATVQMEDEEIIKILK